MKFIQLSLNVYFRRGCGRAHEIRWISVLREPQWNADGRTGYLRNGGAGGPTREPDH